MKKYGYTVEKSLKICFSSAKTRLVKRVKNEDAMPLDYIVNDPGNINDTEDPRNGPS